MRSKPVVAVVAAMFAVAAIWRPLTPQDPELQTIRLPLVMVSGRVSQLPAGDVLNVPNGVTGLPTSSCTNGQVLTAISTSGGGTCSNVIANDYTSTVLDWSEDFTGSVAGNTDVFTTTVSGTGASVASFLPASVGSRVGFVQLKTGTTTTGLARRGFGNNFLGANLIDYYYESVLGPLTLSSAVDENEIVVGFTDNVNGVNATAQGAFFIYDRGNVMVGGVNTTNLQKWEACVKNVALGLQCVILDGTTQGGIVTVNSPVAVFVAPNTNINHLVVNVGVSSTVFQVNGATVATIARIPDGQLNVATLSIKSAGTTDIDWPWDYHHIHMHMTARSP